MEKPGSMVGESEPNDVIGGFIRRTNVRTKRRQTGSVSTVSLGKFYIMYSTVTKRGSKVPKKQSEFYFLSQE